MSWPGLQVSKLGKMQCQNADSLARDVKADDLRQMFLAMTEEVCSLSALLFLSNLHICTILMLLCVHRLVKRM